MRHNIFSNNLKRFRIEKQYTQEQVAEMLMVSAQSISRWECGNTMPDVMLLPEIARVYGVTIDDLYKEDVLAYKNYAQRLLSVYESTGNSEDFIRAEREFQKLLETKEYTPDDLRSFGVLYHYMTKNCAKQAERYFDEVIKHTKSIDVENYYRTCRQKMVLLSETGRSEENIAVQSAALERDAGNPEQWILLIAAYYYANRYEKAYELVLEAIKSFPDEDCVYIYAGNICRALEKYDEAFAYWNKALEIDNTFLDAKYSIGFCYEEIGEYDKAYQTWKELAEELDRRGLTVEKEFPLQLMKNCRTNMD